LSHVKIAVVTYTTDFKHPMLQYFTESLKYWNWPEPHILGGESVWMGHPHKMNLTKAYLPKLKSQGYTHCLFSDGWDVICCGPFDKVVEMCQSYERVGNYAAFISADAGCWTHANLSTDMFPPINSRWKYVNSGGYLGHIDYLIDVLLKDCELETVNDQWFLSKKWVEGPEGLYLDADCEIFQCLSKCDRDLFEIDGIKNDMVRNKETGTNPVLIHGAGQVDMSWVPFFGQNKWKLQR